MALETDMSTVIPDGFPGQKMIVLPRPRVREVLAQPGTSHLVVTDCGYFPQAHLHGRVRQIPMSQTVIIFCVKGRGWCETNAGRFDVRAGQAIILPPYATHSYGAQEDDPWTLWWLHIDGDDILDFLTYYRMTTEAPVRNVSDMYETVSLVAEVIKWMERDTTNASLLAAAGAAWHLMTLLASDNAGSGDAGTAIARSAAYLRDHPNKRTNVTDLADMAGFSSSHFAALFKRHTGFAVGHYQTQLRMASARELLDTTNRSVEEIAHSVGYEDSYYFARQFKKVHGVPPSIYRKHDEVARGLTEASGDGVTANSQSPD